VGMGNGVHTNRLAPGRCLLDFVSVLHGRLAEKE
jgi:hypothetical protein